MNINLDPRLGEPAIYIRETAAGYTRMILDGLKLIETRTRHTLDSVLGRRVWIIRTGKGHSVVVGSIIVSAWIDFATRRDFDLYRFAHRVPAGSRYDWTEDRPKIGYFLLSPEACEPWEFTKLSGNRSIAYIERKV